MDKKKKVVFRRIKGRIVPIRIKEGSFDTAAGLGIAAGSGAAAAAMIRADKYIMPPLARMATGARFRASDSIFGRKRNSVERLLQRVTSTKNTQRALRGGLRLGKALKKSAPAVFIGGALYGGALAGQGVSRLLSEKPDSKTARTAGAGAATASLVATNYSFLRSGGHSPKKSAVAAVQMLPPSIRKIMKLRY